MSGQGFGLAVALDIVLIVIAYVVVWITTGSFSIDWVINNWWTRLTIVVAILILIIGAIIEVD